MHLKYFFYLLKLSILNFTGNFRNRDFALTEDIQRELSPDAPITTRVKAIRELTDAVLVNKLEDVLLNIFMLNLC